MSRVWSVEKIRSQFPKYKVLGDIKIFSHPSPKTIATLMHRSLKKFAQRQQYAK